MYLHHSAPTEPLQVTQGITRDKLYPYTADLMALDSCHPTQGLLGAQLSEIHTPLNPRAWEEAFCHHPDKAFARYINNGLTNGFQIMFERISPLNRGNTNMISVLLHPEVVTAYLQKKNSR